MKRTGLEMAGYLILIILAVTVLAVSVFGSNQSVMSLPLRVTFCGEYKIADGEWKPIEAGKDISALKGNVVLKGYFQTEAPDGEVIGRLGQGSPVALFFNHIGAEIFINGKRQWVFDAENPRVGVSSCGKIWITYEYAGTDGDVVEIVLKNPHKFGNYRAVNDFLDSMYIYTGSSLENMIRKQGNAGRIIGFFIVVISLAVLGIAVFSFLLRLPQSRSVFLVAMMMLFAGGYYILDIPYAGWNESIRFNTCALQICEMFSIFFIMCLVAEYLSEKVKRLCKTVVAAVGVFLAVSIIITLALDTSLYDLNIYWAAVQLPVGLLLLGCCIYSFKNADKNRIMLLLSFVISIIALLLDILGTFTGRWQGGFISKIVFALIFSVILVTVLKVIPSNYLSALKVEKMKSELQSSRISIMLSQIQPHFLYNTLNVISDLCYENPERACEALNDFSTYLRGNIDSLCRHSLVHFSSELMQIEAYLKLEKLRFGDRLNIVYDIQTDDFFVPTLTVQPLVENAVKHGICEKRAGGTLTLRTRRDSDGIVIEIIDDGKGFDTENPAPQNDCHSHIGIINVRSRLQQTVGGSLSIESSPWKGTVATIRIADNSKNKQGSVK